MENKQDIEKIIEELTPEELEAIDTHKYYLSQEADYDVGIEFAIYDWLKHQSKKWRQERIKKDLQEQFEEMLKHKWIESEKAGKDLGEAAFVDWINKYAEQWRKWKEKQDKVKS